jgi:hypothetical protein
MIKKILLLKRLLTWIPRLISKKKNTSRFSGLEAKDLKILGLGSMVLEEYITSRKFRRQIRDLNIAKYIKQMMHEYGENIDDK